MYTLNYVMDCGGQRKGFFEWFSLYIYRRCLYNMDQIKKRETESDQTAEITHRL